MPPIFVNTDNSNKKNKIYIATLTGAASADAEAKIQEIVIKAFAKEADFTTNKIDNAKGYTIMLTVTKFEASGGDTTCTITGEILRYPASKTKKRGSGVEKVMLNRDWTGTATASGKGKGPILQCVEIITETMVPKSFPSMKADMARR